MIVVDSNILAYLYLPGEFTEAAESLLAKHAEWAAPPLWRSELRNILTGYQRRGSLTLAQCQALQAEAEDLMQGGELAVDSKIVLQLTASSTCSAYDCEFVALAVMLQTQLVTMDKKLLREFPQVAMALV